MSVNQNARPAVNQGSNRSVSDLLCSAAGDEEDVVCFQRLILAFTREELV